MAGTSGISIPVGFAGAFGVLREPNGLYYMNARFYDPSMGRFLSEDPLGLAGGDLTLYSYAGNNPVVFVDPSGLCAVSNVSQSNNEMVWSGLKDVTFGGLQVGAGVFLLSTSLIQEVTPSGITQVTGAIAGAAGAWYLVNGVGSIGLGAGKISLGLQNPSTNLQNIPSLPPLLDLLFSPGYPQATEDFIRGK